MEPRGIRNHNPGNIRLSGDKWQGLRDYQEDKEFFQFKSAKWGIRALARVLITYQDKHSLRSVYGIITRWAPSSENNTSSYVTSVARSMGVEKNDILDMHNYVDIEPMVRAIIKHENGKQPYSQEIINEGLKLAGVTVPVRQTLSKDKETQGAAITTGGMTLAAIASEVQGQLEPLIEFSEYIKYAFLALALFGVFMTVRARWRKA